jgi:hypothetical protein
LAATSIRQKKVECIVGQNKAKRIGLTIQAMGLGALGQALGSSSAYTLLTFSLASQ